MKRYQVVIDQSNMQIISRLNYYMFREKLFGAENTNFVMEEYVLIAGQWTGILFPTQPVDLVYDNHPLRIEYSTTRQPRNFKTSIMRFEQLTVSSEESLDAVTAFLDMINELVIPAACEKELTMYIWVDGGWFFSRAFIQRKLETIYFPRRDEIVTAIDRFLNDTEQQKMYRDLDIPYKMICMFHGLPGTGKTSMIRALASHFGYHMCMVKHSQDMDDNSLERMLTRLKTKAFLVFEDIDCIFDQRDVRTKNNISYSGILNMLDGIGNYDKFVVFITTNRLNQLDAAFKRRVDLFVEFGPVRQTEAVKMYRRFFNDSTEDEANAFWKRVKDKKTLTVNMLEKFFIACLRKRVSAQAHLQYLDEYCEMTEENKYNTLYS